MTNDIPNLTSPAMVAFCRRWKVKELALFGSALRDDFRPDSDIDLLLSFKPGDECSLFEFERMQRELRRILGRKVDLVSRDGIENGRNTRRRDVILSTAKVFYAA